MNWKHHERTTARILGPLLLVVALSGAATAGESRLLGTGYAEIGSGVTESLGRPLESAKPFHGGATGLIAQLENGNVLRLGPGASVRCDLAADGDVDVRVLAGRVAVVDGSERAMLAGAGSRFTLPPTVQDAVVAEDRLLSLDLTAKGRLEQERQSGRRGPVRTR